MSNILIEFIMRQYSVHQQTFSIASKHLALFAIIMLTLVACAARQPVPAGELYRGGLINFRAPMSRGWFLMQNDDNGAAFFRIDSPTSPSYIAQIKAFHGSPVNTPDELLVSFKTITEQSHLAHDRYKKPLELYFEISNKRPYPCVWLRGTVEDLKAVMLDSTTVSKPLYIRSFYCQHPRMRDFQFLIIYSQRGGLLDPDLDSQAQSFFDGIQVP